mmetsp:Transcript_19824/g.57515  ORF Transcript_19824/g.57515 Transcript_19824/m.57515 type:complete len:340 (-) Transcript_19824:160-1179(-)|eukprot:CAMPEP_0113555864 /NCGR_PEP_ID=MMETSP0015_2-20120614/16947_1 /TAXON_ID=2838 /ORGANISM="Odontella" /LENGTH=339 /DNA_ID=CAMNT_0000457175 /DNA_START=78 /DNA_END=1097 /DNA_ORIENTATION=- /assembly_acc=CAM_ASM_000160
MNSNAFLITSNAPRKNREETVHALEELLDGPRPHPSDVCGVGPLLVSDVPDKARSMTSAGVVLGIDEAGRGPVLGPMIYSAAYWSPEDAESIPAGFNDSKQLDVKTRNKLFDAIKKTPQIGFVVRVLHASEISRNMLRSSAYNLNAMSHDSAIQMIRAVLDAGVKIDTCYIDTVGVASSYQSKLEKVFQGKDVRFVVEKKADAKYAPCSAASVVAKVSRDAITEKWTWSERDYEPKDGSKDWGSGYPSDPKCKKWIEKNLADPVFGYPDFVRFSWGPAKSALKDDGANVEWESDEEDDEDDDQQMSMSSFVLSKQPKKKPRLECFEKLGLSPVLKVIQI